MNLATVTAIYMCRLDAESGELQIYDEEERLLVEKIIIFDWVKYVTVKKNNSIKQVAATS